MKVKELKTAVVCAFLIGLGGACTSSGSNGVQLSTPWLGPLNGFERVNGTGDFGIFLKKTESAIDRFESGIVVEPEIILAAGTDLGSVPSAAYKKIKLLFSELYRQEMAKKIPTANTDEERKGSSHLIRAVLTNIKITRTKMENSTPPKLSDIQFSFGNSTIEGEVRLRRTNERLAAFILPINAATIGWSALRRQFSTLALQAAAEAGETRKAINTRTDLQPGLAAKTPAKK